MKLDKALCMKLGKQYQILPSIIGSLSMILQRDDIEKLLYDILNFKLSEDSPYKYRKIVNIKDYKKNISILITQGFISDYLNNAFDEQKFYNEMISIIEKNKMYEWDSIMKTGTPHKKKSRFERIGFPDKMYRVRLSWDKRDTQIFSTPIYEDALKEAMNHEGYKVYDDDGNLIKDPWKVKDIHEKTTEYHQSKIYPIKNHIVILADTPVFRTVTDKYPMICLSGSFYFYDDTITKGRAKITKYKDLTKRDPKFILGYIDIKE